MRGALCLLVPLLSCSISHAEEDRRVAIFPLIVSGAVDSRLVFEVQQRLFAGIEGSDVIPVHTSELRILLQSRPRSAIARCERRRVFSDCVARLAAKINVNEVIVGRATAIEKGGTKILLVVIKPDRSVELRATLEVSPGEPIRGRLTKQWIASALDASIAGEPQEEEKTSPDDTAIVAEPASLNPAADGSVTGPVEGPYERRLAGGVRLGVAIPEATAEAARAAHDAAGPMSALGVARLGPAAPRRPNTGRRQAVRDPGPWRTTLRWGALALALSGAGALGAAGYFGSRVHDANSQLQERAGLTQRDAQALGDRAGREAGNANMLLGAGAGAIVTGLSLFFVERLLD